MITINNSDAVISSYKGNKKKYIYNKIDIEPLKLLIINFKKE